MHRRQRRADGNDGGDRGDLAAGHPPNLRIPPAEELVPLRLPQGLARDRGGPAAGLPGLDARPSHARGSRRTPEKWGKTYPAIVRPWESAWAPVRVGPGSSTPRSAPSCTRRTPWSRSTLGSGERSAPAGTHPFETAAVKCVYLTVRSLAPIGTGRQRWINRWKQPLNAFAVASEGRILNTEN